MAIFFFTRFTIIVLLMKMLFFLSEAVAIFGNPSGGRKEAAL